MSATSHNYLGSQVVIYSGTPVFTAGVTGGLLNTLVFFSLRTFRQSSCAFYLTIMSILNICNLFLGLFSRILIALSGINWTETSLFYCKARPYFSQICTGTLMTCWCLATIDPYFATCSHPRWQQWCNITMAYHNVKQIAYRTVPLVRPELDKKLTIMVLIQSVINILSLLSYTTVNDVTARKSLIGNPVIEAELTLVEAITLVFFFMAFASPFYIYICVSERFRKQLIYVLFTIHLNRCRRPRPGTAANQIVPVT